MMRLSGRLRRTALTAVGVTAAGLVAAGGLGAQPAAAAPAPVVVPGAGWVWGATPSTPVGRYNAPVGNNVTWPLGPS